MKILVVDDDLHIQRLYKEEFQDEGYEVVVASNGAEAMEMFERENPDIVTLDILLPDVDGIRILRQMKEKNPKIPVIMSTAYDYRDDFAVWAFRGLHCQIIRPRRTEDHDQEALKQAVMSRKIYLESTPLQEAVSRWLTRLEAERALKPLPEETVSVVDALGRITAEAVIAKISSPFYHSSAMDGYAVRFADTFGASERTPKRLRIGVQAVPVDTGDPMPDGFNAVIMIEDVNIVPAPANEGSDGDGSIEIISPATPWQHVRIIGEDIVATELVLPENQTIRPVDMGAMLAGGYTDVKVRRKPKVTIIPTGDEIVEPGSPLKKGDIIEYNSRILGGLVTEWGGECGQTRHRA